LLWWRARVLVYLFCICDGSHFSGIIISAHHYYYYCTMGYTMLWYCFWKG